MGLTESSQPQSMELEQEGMVLPSKFRLMRRLRPCQHLQSEIIKHRTVLSFLVSEQEAEKECTSNCHCNTEWTAF